MAKQFGHLLSHSLVEAKNGKNINGSCHIAPVHHCNPTPSRREVAPLCPFAFSATINSFLSHYDLNPRFYWPRTELEGISPKFVFSHTVSRSSARVSYCPINTDSCSSV
ncbi:hypothetical protein K7X08_010406 [Anisodus acutangulus]|uniref:Uncharacterized protein n=1 Tax=Anisodus acutangulus TaxID=402998 RepID=A0A9Q1N546_9SOLA|nr:hypothetical protein K7X08_010406 [Anisodus acutangulus]